MAHLKKRKKVRALFMVQAHNHQNVKSGNIAFEMNY